MLRRAAVAPQPIPRARRRAREKPSIQHTLRIDTPGNVSPSLVGGPRRRRALLGRHPQNVQVHGQLALRLSRLISTSRNASSYFGRPRSAFCAPSRNRSSHSSTSATFKTVPPCCPGCRRLTSEHADYQGCATFRRPALYFLGLLFVCHLPPCILESQVSDKRRLGRASSIATWPSEAAGEQEATRPVIRSKARTVDGAAEKRARIRRQGGAKVPVAVRRKEMGRVSSSDRGRQAQVGCGVRVRGRAPVA
jgi:hypothetical protein